MNKKNIAWKTLIITLLINQSSFTMQAPLPLAIACSALCGTLGYGLAKVSALFKVRTYEDAPQNIQTWARDILTKKNITNADSVPLKLGNGWCVYGGHFIQVDKKSAQNLEENLSKNISLNTEKERALAEATLLHEAKHYQNRDGGKDFLMHSLSAIPLFYYMHLSAKKIPVAKFLIAITLPVINYITHTRYNELEADRFAFMNLSSIKKLKINKDWALEQAEIFEYNSEFFSPSRNKNWLVNKIQKVLSNKIFDLNPHLIKNSDKELHMQRKILFGISNFIYDHKHPSFRRRASLAEECLEKRRLIENSQ